MPRWVTCAERKQLHLCMAECVAERVRHLCSTVMGVWDDKETIFKKSTCYQQDEIKEKSVYGKDKIGRPAYNFC